MLGIEGQRQALAHFAQAEGFTVAREFVEVETGKGSDALDRRPLTQGRPRRRKEVQVSRGGGEAGPPEP